MQSIDSSSLASVNSHEKVEHGLRDLTAPACPPLRENCATVIAMLAEYYPDSTRLGDYLTRYFTGNTPLSPRVPPHTLEDLATSITLLTGPHREIFAQGLLAALKDGSTALEQGTIIEHRPGNGFVIIPTLLNEVRPRNEASVVRQALELLSSPGHTESIDNPSDRYAYRLSLLRLVESMGPSYPGSKPEEYGAVEALAKAPWEFQAQALRSLIRIRPERAASLLIETHQSLEQAAEAFILAVDSSVLLTRIDCMGHPQSHQGWKEIGLDLRRAHPQFHEALSISLNRLGNARASYLLWL